MNLGFVYGTFCFIAGIALWPLVIVAAILRAVYLLLKLIITKIIEGGHDHEAGEEHF